ncbi:hypothetical protein IMZ48_49885, partial [Candidatus Bathyarchaeota archaeon]|nr:hypothetical protein [Candidatus Bathyarchaeota archaeon]
TTVCPVSKDEDSEDENTAIPNFGPPVPESIAIRHLPPPVIDTAAAMTTSPFPQYPWLNMTGKTIKVYTIGPDAQGNLQHSIVPPTETAQARCPEDEDAKQKRLREEAVRRALVASGTFDAQGNPLAAGSEDSSGDDANTV